MLQIGIKNIDFKVIRRQNHRQKFKKRGMQIWQEQEKISTSVRMEDGRL